MRQFITPSSPQNETISELALLQDRLNTAQQIWDGPRRRLEQLIRWYTDQYEALSYVPVRTQSSRETMQRISQRISELGDAIREIDHRVGEELAVSIERASTVREMVREDVAIANTHRYLESVGVSLGCASSRVEVRG